MRLVELARRTLARTDVRAALTIAALVLAALVVQGLALYAYVGRESLEEADRWMGHALRSIALRVERGDPLEAAVADLRAAFPGHPIAVRVLDGEGAVAAGWGTWPRAEEQVETGHGPDARAAFRAWRDGVDQQLVGSASLSGARRLELAMPLLHFHKEAAELGRRIAVVGALSALVALITGLFASLHAFAPLRRATRVLRGVDAGELDRRLATRGTGDPVDRHAETLNRVLARIDAAFGRLRAFSSDAAHELRTPLNRIANVVDVALQGGEDREQRAALETIRETTDELSRMVQSLLLLAELGDRRAALRWPELDVDAWIARTAELYAPSFEERGVKLAVRSAAGTLEGDRMLLDRILVNLLDNALAQLGAGGRVEIEAQRTQNGVTICVDDSGPGIPELERERVFERFAHADRGTRSGHGLGLAIARAVARLHGGDIEIERSPLGGARFCVRLPRRGTGARAEPRPRGAQKRRV